MTSAALQAQRVRRAEPNDVSRIHTYTRPPGCSAPVEVAALCGKQQKIEKLKNSACFLLLYFKNGFDVLDVSFRLLPETRYRIVMHCIVFYLCLTQAAKVAELSLRPFAKLALREE